MCRSQAGGACERFVVLSQWVVKRQKYEDEEVFYTDNFTWVGRLDRMSLVVLPPRRLARSVPTNRNECPLNRNQSYISALSSNPFLHGKQKLPQNGDVTPEEISWACEECAHVSFGGSKIPGKGEVPEILVATMYSSLQVSSATT